MGIGRWSTAIVSCSVNFGRGCTWSICLLMHLWKSHQAFVWVQRNLEVLQKVQSINGMGSSCLKKIPKEFSGQSQSHAQINPLLRGYLTTVGSRKIAEVFGSSADRWHGIIESLLTVSMINAMLVLGSRTIHGWVFPEMMLMCGLLGRKVHSGW